MSDAQAGGGGRGSETFGGITPNSPPRLRTSDTKPPALDEEKSSTFNAPRLSPRARGRLTNLLFAKLTFELLFVVALAAGFHYVTFNPYFRGSLDRADEGEVSGWAVDDARPDARVEVQLYIDERFIAGGVADGPRPDVRDAGRARDEFHGFRFATPTLAPGEHEARVYAVHASGGGARRVLRQIGGSIRFRVTS